MHLEMFVLKILAHRCLMSMVLQNYHRFIEMTSSMIYIFVLAVGLKSSRKINLNTQWEVAIRLKI